MPKYVVRYGIMRSLGVLSVRGKDQSFLRGDNVVARTKRGLEIGEVLCEAHEESLTGSKDYEQGEILRTMTANDANEIAHIDSEAGNEFQTCRKYVKQLGLQFGGERIIVYYLAEDRVDFRELVRRLAKEFQTRIEMRQIGVRDEAKLLADYGDCGKPVCCNTHLTSMPPVSMKMAKLQKATLDPNKISGRCGRLKCCLRYEYESYVEMQKELPPVGSEIVTNQGKATVLSQEILAGQLLIESEDHRRSVIDASEVVTVIRAGRGKRKSNKDRRGPKRSNKSKSAKNEGGSNSPKKGRSGGTSKSDSATSDPTVKRAEAKADSSDKNNDGKASDDGAAPPTPGNKE